jgi:hypothetical protein
MRPAGTLGVLLAAAIVASAPAPAAALDAALEEKLASSKYVYISSQRKDGSFGKPAEIWFLYDQDAVWVGTPPTSWRVKRLEAGRPAAKIAVGSSDGLSFAAVGSVVHDPKVLDRMYEAYARKYPDRWPGYEQRFREGMKDGSRVLVKYVPASALITGPTARVSPVPASPRPSARD